MSEKIEINTLITKHENKCKDCRFEMIDVEDPLWEYGSPLKRVLLDNWTGETYDDVSKLVVLLNEQHNEIIKLLDENDEYEKDSEVMQQKINVLYHEVLMAKEHMTSQGWERFKQRRKEREEEVGIKWVKL